jgi:hypothetical protein
LNNKPSRSLPRAARLRRPRHAAFIAAFFVAGIVLSPALVLPDRAWAKDPAAGSVKFSASSGGSRAVFAVEPPAGAKCPGDTAHKSFLVNSYLVRKGTSPTSVNFRGGVPSRGYGLITDGAYYGAINTARDTGALFTLPEHATWSRLTTDDVFPNRESSTTWETGIACADATGAVQRYWNAEVTFTADAKDPGGYEWQIVGQSDASKGSTGVSLVAALVVVIAGGAAFVIIRSRRRRKPAGRTR